MPSILPNLLFWTSEDCPLETIIKIMSDAEPKKCVSKWFPRDFRRSLPQGR